MATAPLASTSVGTIDVQSLVSQLMSVERQPIDTLNAQVTSYQTKISSFGTISGLVSGFQAAAQGLITSVQGFSATPSDTSIFSASATSAAVPGNYSLEVTHLAQAQNLVAAGKASSTTAISDGTATTVTFDFGTIDISATNSHGGGSLSGGTYTNADFVSNGSGTHSITIDNTNNTLQGIRDAINAANMGVSATIINDGSGTPYRLALTSNNSGVSNSLKITTSGGDGTIDSLLAYDPAGTQNLNQTVTAQNADFKVNGITISKTTNAVTDAIQGVTLTLNNPTTVPAALTVAHDTNAVSAAASKFVDAYNALTSQLKSRSAFGNAATSAGELAGDGTIRLMQNQLRDIFNAAASGGTLSYLAQIGITTQTDGTLKLDSNQLSSAMTSNFADVTNLFSSATGFATRFDAWSSSVLSPGNGLIATRTSSLNTSIQGYNDRISSLEARMKALQALYTQQYTNLNMLLSNMNNTSTYLTQQFAKNSGTTA